MLSQQIPRWNILGFWCQVDTDDNGDRIVINLKSQHRSLNVLPGCISLNLIIHHNHDLIMAVAAQNTNNTTIRSILQQKKLTGPNFTNWYKNLRIVLRSEGKLDHLEQPLIPLPYPVASQAMRDAYEALYDAQNEVACLMFGSMSPDLQRTLENYKAYDMIQELKTMFEEQAKHELFETVKGFHACKQEDGQSVRSYLLKMKSYLDTLERLGYGMPNELGVSLILNSLNKDYDQFVQNYNMHTSGKTLAELHAMLILHEKGIPKKAETPAVLAIREGRIQKDKKKPQGAKGKDKGKNKLAYAPSLRSHRRLREIIRKKTLSATTVRRLRESRKLKHGALSLYMGNGMRAAVKGIGSFDLILPSGLIIVLDNCHFAPTVTRGVVSISRLVNNGYIYTFMNYGISVSKDNVFYFNAIPHDGIYGIDMHNLYSNVNSMYNVSNKRAKRALDSSYLWHCRLCHINKKRMDKLQRDGILQPTHDESLEKSVDRKSAKQSTTAMSSTEAEYIAAAKASIKAVWMRKFIDGLGNVMPSNKRPMEMKYHYIREVIQEPEIILKKVHTDDNVADPFTKPMPFNKHYEHAMGIGIVHASSLM
ncbi:zinc finger, CCHC-type containing protein [Tanacetum coccineum]